MSQTYNYNQIIKNQMALKSEGALDYQQPMAMQQTMTNSHNKNLGLITSTTSSNVPSALSQK